MIFCALALLVAVIDAAVDDALVVDELTVVAMGYFLDSIDVSDQLTKTEVRQFKNLNKLNCEILAKLLCAASKASWSLFILVIAVV